MPSPQRNQHTKIVTIFTPICPMENETIIALQKETAEMIGDLCFLSNNKQTYEILLV